MEKARKIISLIMMSMILISTLGAMPIGFSSPFSKEDHQGGDPEYSIHNEYLSLYVEYGLADGVGTACLETSEGYDLLYTSRDHDAWSSYLTVQIDGVNYANAPFSPSLNNYVIQNPTIVGNSIVTKWSIDTILIEQTIELVGKAAKWMFTITNTGASNKQIKVRYLFDYQVRDQDGAPICIPGGPILKKETKFVEMEINFDYWFTRDYLDSTYSVQGVHTLATQPYMIIFANWAYAYQHLFDYPDFDPNRAFYTPGQIYSPQSDSCALIYWDLGEITPGQAKQVITYYGVGAPSPTGLEAVKLALNDFEDYVISKIESSYYNYAKATARALKRWGEWFKNVTLQYYKYRAGLTSPNDVDANVREMADQILKSEYFNETWAELNYNYLTEMFDQINADMNENEIIQKVYQFLINKAQPAIDWFTNKFSIIRANILGNLSMIQDELSESDFQHLAEAIINFKKRLLYPRQHESFLLAVEKLNEQFAGEVYFSLVERYSSPGVAVAIIMVLIAGLSAYGGYVAAHMTHKITKPVGEAVTNTCSKIVPPEGREQEVACKTAGAVSGILASEAIFGKPIGFICVGTPPIIGVPFCVSYFVTDAYLTITDFQKDISESPITSESVKEYIYEQTHASLVVLSHEASDIHEPSDEQGVIGVGTGKIRVKNNGNVAITPDIGPEGIIIEGAAAHASVISLPPQILPGEEALIEYKYVVNLASIASGSCGYYQSKVTIHISDINQITTFSNFFQVCNMRNPQESQAIQKVSIETVVQGSIIEGQTFTTSFTTEPNSRRCVFSLSYAGSDLDLHIYDEYGNHVGLNYFTGEVENQIEGSWYSGPNTYPEMVQISGNIGSKTYTIKIVAVTTEETGTEFIVSAREVPEIPPIMRLSPKYIELELKPGESEQTPICVSETGGISSLSNVTLEATDLVYHGKIIPKSNIQFNLNNFDIEASSFLMPLMNITIPENTLLGSYIGKIIATTEDGINDESTLIINVRGIINATVDVDPDTLNIGSKGNWVTVYVELPEGYNVSDINIASITLNGTIPVDLTAPYEIGDYDNDGIPDLMVKFNRTAVSELILSKGVKCGNVTLTVSGRLYNGTEFMGSDTIRVRMPGDINMDGKVDMKDIVVVAKAFGTFPGRARWNPIADENEDGKIDIRDIVLTCKNFGKTYT